MDTPGIFGRGREIAAFDRLLASPGEPWAMIVDGLAGTGKSFLVAWLSRHRAGDWPRVVLDLDRHVEPTRALEVAATAFGIDVARRYRERLREIAAVEAEQALVHYAPAMHVQASWKSAVSTVAQHANVHLDAAALLPLRAAEQRRRRIEAFLEAVDPIPGERLLVFVDSAEQMSGADSELRAFVWDELVPRLRERFPGLRLYLTGQSVDDPFGRREALRFTLDALDEEAARALLAERGVVDPARVAEILAATLGNPQLLDWEADNPTPRDGAPAPGRKFGDATRWIVDRMISRLGDAGARAIAAELSLLEWFDLGLLRAVFGDAATEQAFDELLARSIVKPRADGRYACHNVIRAHLPKRQWKLDPDRCREVHRRAREAYLGRAASIERAEGNRLFAGRLDCVRGALASALAVDREAARALVDLELAVAIARDEAEYAFRLARLCDEHDDDGLRGLARATRTCLEALATLTLDAPAGDAFWSFAETARASGFVDEASDLAGASIVSSRAAGKLDRAIARAREALATYRKPAHAARLVDALDASGDHDAAARALAEARAELGTAPALALVEASIAITRRDVVAAKRIYAHVIATSPDDCVAARLGLARLLAEEEALEPALAEVERALADDPNHLDARALQIDLLGALGRFDEIVDSSAWSPALLSRGIASWQSALRALANPTLCRRLLAQLELGPARIGANLALLLGDAFASRGDTDEVDRVAAVIDARWSEGRELAAATRARARVIAGRPDEGAALLWPLVERGTRLPGAYVTLAAALVAADRLVTAREVWEKLAQRIPAFAAFAEAQAIEATARVDGVPAALERARKLDPERAAAPPVRANVARLLALNGEIDPALAAYEEVIHTEGTDELPLDRLIELRAEYAVFLLRAGHRDRARAITEGLRDRFPGDEKATRLAAMVFAELGDEAALRDLVERVPPSSIRLYSALLELLARVTRAREPDVEKLFEALAREPDRIELLTAITLPDDKSTLKSMEAISERANAVAPQAARRLAALRREVVGVVDPAFVEHVQRHRAMYPPAQRLGHAVMMAEAGRIPDALDELEALRRDHAQAEIPVAFEARLLIGAGRIDAAERLLTPYLGDELPPAEVEAQVVHLLAARQKSDRLVELVRRLSEARPELRKDRFVAAAEHLLKHERAADALALLEELDAADDLDVATSRANALARLGRHDEVLGALEPVWARPEGEANLRGLALRQRGDAERALGREDQAIASYREAIAIHPESIQARLRLAEVLEARGETAEAYDMLLEAVARDPKRLREREADLRRLAQAG